MNNIQTTWLWLWITFHVFYFACQCVSVCVCNSCRFIKLDRIDMFLFHISTIAWLTISHSMTTWAHCVIVILCILCLICTKIISFLDPHIWNFHMRIDANRQMKNYKFHETIDRIWKKKNLTTRLCTVFVFVLFVCW